MSDRFLSVPRLDRVLAKDNYTALGHAKNIVARLCGTAGPGEILILESTYEAAAEQRRLYKGIMPMPHLGFSSKGKLQFKNVDEPIEVISVTQKP